MTGTSSAGSVTYAMPLLIEVLVSNILPATSIRCGVLPLAVHAQSRVVLRHLARRCYVLAGAFSASWRCFALPCCMTEPPAASTLRRGGSEKILFYPHGRKQQVSEVEY